MKKRKYAIVNLKGGLGNQIFQLNFALKLKNNGFKVFVNTTNFEKSKKIKNRIPNLREQIFSVEMFDLKKLNDFLFMILEFVIKITNNYFVLKVDDKNFDEINFKKVNYFDGYWQDISSLKENISKIQEILSKNTLIKESLNFAPEIGSTLIHVRRSDYIKMNEELGENFYIEAIKVAKKEIVDFKFSVFTDDFNWVNNNKIFDEAENIYYSSNSVDDTIEAFSQMLKFENFIVGNSTFSLVAAITKNLDKSKIIIANPWFRNIEKNIDIQEAIKLENK